MAAWSVNDVGTWLETMSLGQYRECFADGSVDGSFLYDVNDDDLHNTLGIEHKLHRKKILNSIRRLKFAEEEQMRKKAAAEARRAGGGADVRGGMPPTEANALADAAAAARPGGLPPDEGQLAAAESQREQDLMTIDPEKLFSWARHGKYANITKVRARARSASGIKRNACLSMFASLLCRRVCAELFFLLSEGGAVVVSSLLFFLLFAVVSRVIVAGGVGVVVWRGWSSWR